MRDQTDAPTATDPGGRGTARHRPTARTPGPARGPSPTPAPALATGAVPADVPAPGSAPARGPGRGRPGHAPTAPGPGPGRPGPAPVAPGPGPVAPGPGPGPAAPRPLGEPRSRPRSFADRLTTPLPGVRAFARLAREGAFLPLPDAGPGTLCATWAGHASWVLRVGGLTVLTDPVWSRRIVGTPARITPMGVRREELPPVDAVVISHNHYDHLDAPTLKRLPRHTPLFVPAGLARWCRRRGFTHVTELDWWESAEPGGVRFDFVPAHHWSKRSLIDTCRTLWGGWVLTYTRAAAPRKV